MGKLPNYVVDELVRLEYEDALADEEPWALDSYEYRKAALSPDEAAGGE